jgi:hypothetical protein
MNPRAGSRNPCAASRLAPPMIAPGARRKLDVRRRGFLCRGTHLSGHAFVGARIAAQRPQA